MSGWVLADGGNELLHMLAKEPMLNRLFGIGIDGHLMTRPFELGDHFDQLISPIRRSASTSRLLSRTASSDSLVGGDSCSCPCSSYRTWTEKRLRIGLCWHACGQRTLLARGSAHRECVCMSPAYSCDSRGTSNTRHRVLPRVAPRDTTLPDPPLVTT